MRFKLRQNHLIEMVLLSTQRKILHILNQCYTHISFTKMIYKKLVPQSHSIDQPMALGGRVKER